MIASLAWHELRQQVRGRVFWIVFAVSVLMVTGAMVIDELRVGAIEGKVGGVSAIMRTHLVWSLFFLFTAAALVGEAALRDEINGFGDLVRATPVRRGSYVIARFLGSFSAVLLCFTSVPMSLALGGAALGSGSGPGGSYLFAFFVLALPNLLLASALFFMLAGVTRSMTGCLLGAAALLTLYGLAGEGRSVSVPIAVVEPFGFSAVAWATRGWSAAQRDASWPALAGMLLANRLLWLSLAATLVGLGTWMNTRDRFRNRKSRMVSKSLADAAHHPVREALASDVPRSPRWRIIVTQLQVRSWFEVRSTVLTPAFQALLVMGLAAAVLAAAKVQGTPSTIVALTTSFQLVPVVVALFFAGELFWAEREHNVAGIIAGTPIDMAVLVLAKFLALVLILLSLALASAAAGAATEFAEGRAPVLSLYLAWYVLPRFYDWLLLGALALFLQSLAPSKLAGWGYMVFYLIGSLALNRLGWHDPLYRYGGYPGAPLPPALSGADHVGWYRLGWGTAALGMIAMSCRRGLPSAHPSPPSFVMPP